MKVIPAVKSDLMKSSGSRNGTAAYIKSYTVRHSHAGAFAELKINHDKNR